MRIDNRSFFIHKNRYYDEQLTPPLLQFTHKIAAQGGVFTSKQPFTYIECAIFV